jgi:hypothetical protein
MAHVREIRGRVSRAVLCALSAGAIVCASGVGARADETPGAAFAAHFGPTVPASVRGAVEFAMGIWSQRIESAVPIEVDVEWGGGLPRGVASSTEPITYEPVADGSLQPAALANALAGRDLAPGTSDIRLLLGSGVRWYTGVDGRTPASSTDMVTMVLHELAHGLGFADSFRLAGGGLAWGRSGTPVGLDAHLSDASTGSLIALPDAHELLASATSRRIMWNGAARDSHGRAPVIYAPSQFEPGSSLCHFDDNAYPQGDPDALMTSLIRRGEVIHRVGPATLGVLADLGWRVRAEPAAVAAPAPKARTVVPAAAAAAPAVTTTAPPAPVLPQHLTARHTAAAGDFGRTGVTGIGAAVPMLVIALGWRIRRFFA